MLILPFLEGTARDGEFLLSIIHARCFFVPTTYLLSRAGVMARQIANLGRPFQRENRNLSAFACRVPVGVAGATLRASE